MRTKPASATKVSTKSWTPAFQQLLNAFHANEEKLQLLNDVSRIDDAQFGDIEQFFSNLPLQKIASNFDRSEGAYIFFATDDAYHGVCEYAEASIPPNGSGRKIIPKAAVPEMDSGHPIILNTKDQPHDDPWAVLFPDSILLIEPLLLHGEPHGMLIVQDYKHASVSSALTPLVNDDHQLFIEKLGSQISVSLGKAMDRLYAKALLDIHRAFHELNMHPINCFRHLAQNIHRLLPIFSPLDFEPPVAAQILIDTIRIGAKEKPALQIVGTTGAEAQNTLIDMDDSVSGILFSHPGKDFLLCNPQVEYPELYKSYLLQQEVHSELIAPIRHKGTLFGVINLEHPAESAFQSLHIKYLLKAALDLAPVLYSLRESMEEISTLQYAVLRTLDKTMGQYAHQFNHRLKAPQTALRIDLDQLKRLIEAKRFDEIGGEIDRARSSLKTMADYRDSFLANITGFAETKIISLASLIAETTGMFDLKELEARRILFVQRIEKDFQTLSTMFLRETLYNLLNNAIYWTQKRVIVNSEHQGRIVVSLREAPNPEAGKEIELNRFCFLSVEDNGTGVTEDEKEKVFDRDFTKSENGSGFGLYLAKRYIDSIGGDITVDSEPGSHFKVTIMLRQHTL
ncbi:MAG: HAMP domain-containing histidine kinase [Nitrospinae bacterium]|nr:HAMP domain-containing histidine kinase [Nitrospinota bacterium]